jgi:hypothetical protein
MGMCPREAMEGDMVWILKGGPVPYVLRHSGHSRDQNHLLVGEAYCQRVMWGEAIRAKREAFKSNGTSTPGDIWTEIVIV